VHTHLHALHTAPLIKTGYRLPVLPSIDDLHLTAMKAYLIDEYVKPSELHKKLTDNAPEPVPSEHEVVVEVQYVLSSPLMTDFWRERERRLNVDFLGQRGWIEFL
jgi:hypothetical protein